MALELDPFRLRELFVRRLSSFISFLKRAITLAASVKYPLKGDPTNELHRSIGS